MHACVSVSTSMYTFIHCNYESYNRVNSLGWYLFLCFNLLMVQACCLGYTPQFFQLFCLKTVNSQFLFVIDYKK